MAGQVRVEGHTIYRPGHMIDREATIELMFNEPYVSRGGTKLAAALVGFKVDPSGKICLDIGASTGGFTDCLIQRRAERVHSVDVGKGQLDWQLRHNPRVVVREGINARYLTFEDISEQVDLVTIDVSFISLRLILPPLHELVNVNGELITLVKPQFEAGKSEVKRGGVVRDPAVHLGVLEKLRLFVEETTPWGVASAICSPLIGPAGNMEFFFHLRNKNRLSASIDLDALVERAHGDLERKRVIPSADTGQPS